jgi:hypothetical protein
MNPSSDDIALQGSCLCNNRCAHPIPDENLLLHHAKLINSITCEGMLCCIQSKKQPHNFNVMNLSGPWIRSIPHITAHRTEAKFKFLQFLSSLSVFSLLCSYLTTKIPNHFYPVLTSLILKQGLRCMSYI